MKPFGFSPKAGATPERPRKFTIELTGELRDGVKRMALLSGLSQNAVIIQMIAYALEHASNGQEES